MVDYYQILGIDSDSDFQKIKSAYRKLALQWHPDKNKDPNAASMFIKIHEAYEILIDPTKKRLYDNVYHSTRKKPSSSEVRKDDEKNKEQQRKYEEQARNARTKAETYSKMPFNDFVKIVIDGAKEVALGCQSLYILSFAVVFLVLGVKAFIGLFEVFPNYADSTWWKGTLAFLALLLLSLLFLFLAYLIAKSVFKKYRR